MASTAEATPTRDEAAVLAFELTVDLYARMVESGLIPHDRRVFLLDGGLYEKMARTRAHGSVGPA